MIQPHRLVADSQQAVELGIAGLGPAVRIGSGGFAEVYQAEQTSLRRPVAIKVLRAQASDSQARMRFERECHAVGAVSGHPNIVGVHGGGFTNDGRAYLVMELCPGGSLLDRIRRSGPMPAADVIDIGVKIGKALGVAHDAGVLHRDVKPANILVTAFGEPALADFGIARVEGGQQTATGMITASIVHAAPEVLEGAQPSTGSDLYSLGSTLFELFVGRAPHFRPDDESVWALMNRVLNEPIPDPASVGMPEPLASVIRRATARHPEARYASASPLVVDLSATGATAQVSGPPPGPPARAPQPPPAAVTDPAGTAQLATEMMPQIHESGAPPAAAPAVTTIPRRVGDGSSSGLLAPPRKRRRAGSVVVVGLILVIMGAASAGVWYSRTSGSDAPPLSFPEGASGPLDAGVSYEVAVEGGGSGATYRLVVDGEPVGEPTATLDPFVPEAGRHSVAVEVTSGSSTQTTEALEVYAIGELPEDSFRANLSSVPADPASWPATIEAFDELQAAGHDDLLLLPSDRFTSLVANHWSMFVAGFEDASEARAYCQSHDLAIPADCFTAPFRPHS